jgi:hypothetical protein
VSPGQSPFAQLRTLIRTLSAEISCGTQAGRTAQHPPGSASMPQEVARRSAASTNCGSPGRYPSASGSSLAVTGAVNGRLRGVWTGRCQGRLAHFRHQSTSITFLMWAPSLGGPVGLLPTYLKRPSLTERLRITRSASARIHARFIPSPALPSHVGPFGPATADVPNRGYDQRRRSASPVQPPDPRAAHGHGSRSRARPPRSPPTPAALRRAGIVRGARSRPWVADQR